MKTAQSSDSPQQSPVLWRVLLKPWTRRYARELLVGRRRSKQPDEGRFVRPEVDAFIKAAWLALPALVAELPELPTVGSRLNARLACLTLALFRALLDHGVERAYAIELTSDLTWKFYSKGATVSRWFQGKDSRRGLGFVRAEDLVVLKRGDTVPLGFPFNPPGYIACYVPTTTGSIAFDVVHCPVSDLFRAHDAGDLCVGAWCNLDFPLGEATGQKLSRNKTLANGDDRCTFRLSPAAAPPTLVARDSLSTPNTEAFPS